MLGTEVLKENLPIRIIKRFDLTGYSKACFVLKSPLVSLLSFKGRIILRDQNEKIKTVLLINDVYGENEDQVSVRLVEIRPMRAKWIAKESTKIIEIDQDNPIINLHMILDWYKRGPSFGEKFGKVPLELSVKVE